MKFRIDPSSCVACLACVRVCPTDAIAVEGRESLRLEVLDEACVRCGQCVPACPHHAVRVESELDLALEVARQGRGILIVSLEAVAHFYPAFPEQLVNACYAAGFRVVTHGIMGDELVAAAYLRLWDDEPWGTLIRSTDPAVVETIEVRYPELVPYLAPIAMPPVAEARYLRALHGAKVPIVYAGIASPVLRQPRELDAILTFDDLDQLLRRRDVDVAQQSTFFTRVPEERRRYLSMPGGMPRGLLEGARQSSRKFRKVRGLDALKTLARAVTVERRDLGFVDLLSTEGALAHPLAGPEDELYWRRELLATIALPRASAPVVEAGIAVDLGATFPLRPPRPVPGPSAVEAVLAEIGLGPHGRSWDCQACGFETCLQFAVAAAEGRASLRQCPPYQERRRAEAERTAALDALTGLAAYGVLRERLTFEIERCRRSAEPFTLLFLDLDRFKQLNDHYGHEAGNQILQAVAAEIRQVVRASDVAARYGGDEFVVILTRTDRNGAARAAEALRQGVEAAGQRLGYPPGAITVSVGLAEFDPQHASDTDLLAAADRALYRAKGAGRNIVA